MTLPKGRVLKGPVDAASSVDPGGVTNRAARLVKSALADASAMAFQTIAAAEERARVIVAEAEEAARAVREGARDEGRREGAAELAAAWVKLRTEEERKDERELDRTLELATAMAERLLGEALVLDPAKVVGIAKQALGSARQARRIALKAHPDDAEALRREIALIALEGAAIEIHVEPARSRGSLLLETDLGILDADLTIQLDRLARSLRDSLRSG
jgi:flagellar biosynthesis/type III secretory pathway protein FliH